MTLGANRTEQSEPTYLIAACLFLHGGNVVVIKTDKGLSQMKISNSGFGGGANPIASFKAS